MGYLKKTIAPWEVKYGQIHFFGQNYLESKDLFADYLHVPFDIETPAGVFRDRHFIEQADRLRLSCATYFRGLHEGDTLYLQPGGPGKICILNHRPDEQADNAEQKMEGGTPGDGGPARLPEGTRKDVVDFIMECVKENRALREENQRLLEYKERLEKYDELMYIFEDERFMEDWLERNIHKAIPSLEVVDRQPTARWDEPFLSNRLDFFCMDSTTKELVIVENKVRGRNRRVETQYLAYRAWVRKNLDKINTKYAGKGLRATKDFKFVIITDTTDERLTTVCEDSDICLVLIDGGVMFEEIVPYHHQ